MSGMFFSGHGVQILELLLICVKLFNQPISRELHQIRLDMENRAEWRQRTRVADPSPEGSTAWKR